MGQNILIAREKTYFVTYNWRYIYNLVHKICMNDFQLHLTNVFWKVFAKVNATNLRQDKQ